MDRIASDRLRHDEFTHKYLRHTTNLIINFQERKLAYQFESLGTASEAIAREFRDDLSGN